MEILNVGGSRISLVDKEVERRSSANGAVKSGVLTPEEIAELDEKLKHKAGPQVKPWEPTLSRDQYLQLRIEGKNRRDITLMHFNNEESKLVKQLREWKLIDRNREEEAMTKKQLDELTREQYLARRAAGETRTKIMRSIGANTVPFYAKLEGWGLKNKAEEDKALAELRPDDASSAGADFLERVEVRAADQEKESLDLKAEKSASTILDLERQIAELTEARINDAAEAEGRVEEIVDRWSKVVAERDLANAGLNDKINEVNDENKLLKEAIEGAAVVAIQSGSAIADLEAENSRLKIEIRTANDVVDGLRSQIRILEAERDRNRGFIFLRLPILTGDHPIRQRINLYDGIDKFSTEIESSSLNRERATIEFFQLAQLFVGFIHSEMEDLHPDQDDVLGFVKRYFAFHNQRHCSESLHAVEHAV